MRWPMTCLLSVLLVPSAPARAQEPDCRQQLLALLGWQFEVAPVTAPRVLPGRPCDRDDLAQAQAAGDLRVQLPLALRDAQRTELLDGLMRDPATVCAFGFRLGDATRRAVDALVANPGYRFSALQLGWIGFGLTGAARDGWRRIAPFGRGYVPRAGNWDAIQAFYRGQVRSECGVGRQVAQYAAQAELFGRAGFDTAFSADEIAIGTWHVLNRSGGILQGASAGTMTRDGLARTASALGRQALVGVPGYIGHVFDARYLDDIHNQAQNFVVYDVAPEAAAALRRHRGFAHYNRLMREAWVLARSLPRSGRHGYSQLLTQRDPRVRARLAGGDLATLERLEAILADPFFTGFRIYVHRHGVQPVAYHLVRMLDRNPRTPFKIEFALHNVHTTLMQRWIAYQLEACVQAGGGET